MEENGRKRISVKLESGLEIPLDAGTTLLELSRDCQEPCRPMIIAARVGNDIRELGFRLEEDCRVGFIDISNEDGMRIYRRSLYFILVKAVREPFPRKKSRNKPFNKQGPLL